MNESAEESVIGCGDKLGCRFRSPRQHNTKSWMGNADFLPSLAIDQDRLVVPCLQIDRESIAPILAECFNHGCGLGIENQSFTASTAEVVDQCTRRSIGGEDQRSNRRTRLVGDVPVLLSNLPSIDSGSRFII